MAQHALVLGPSDNVESDPTETGFLAQPVNTAFNQIPHRNLTNLNLHAWLLEPHHSRSRVFSEAVAQELRQSEPFFYFTNWYLTNQVDFMAPPCKVSC